MNRRVRNQVLISAREEQRAELVRLHRSLSLLGETCAERPGKYRLVGPGGESLALPEAAFDALGRIVEVMARGEIVAVVPVKKELTTQQAADILNVSRQYMVRLLDEEKLPFHRVGTHRRVRVDDLLRYKQKRDRDRRARLDEITRLGQESGGYDT